MQICCFVGHNKAFGTTMYYNTFQEYSLVCFSIDYCPSYFEMPSAMLGFVQFSTCDTYDRGASLVCSDNPQMRPAFLTAGVGVVGAGNFTLKFVRAADIISSALGVVCARCFGPWANS